jgi:hypothetical protein
MTLRTSEEQCVATLPHTDIECGSRLQVLDDRDE